MLGAISAGLGALGGIAGFFADKKQNKLMKKQLENDKRMTDEQIRIGRYIEQLSKQAMDRDFSFQDAFGGGATIDPVTGKYTANISPEKRAIQKASFAEELDRMIQDQSIRRRGLNDYERMRQKSSTRADTALADIDAARLGVGRVDPNAIGGQLRADRSRAINAGYDDAERAASTLQLRTGSSAVGDALNRIARDRARAYAETMGSPELEGLEFAEGINQNRDAAAMQRYGQFGDEARSFYDAGFAPATYDAESLANVKDLMKLDLSKFDLAMGGSGTAASTIGDAAAGLRQGYDLYNKGRIHAPLSKALTGFSNALSSFKG